MNRFIGILVIYVTRPMCWLFALVLLVALCVTTWSSDSDRYVPNDKGIFSQTVKILGYQKHVNSQKTLTAAVESSDGRPVDVNYGRLAVDLQLGPRETDDTGAVFREMLGPNEAMSRLSQIQFPTRTHSLTTSSLKVGQSTIQQICKVGSLKHLKFGSAESDSVPLDLSPLVELKNLNSLDLGDLTNVISLAPLQQLPKLETLTIGSTQLVTTQTMRQVAATKSLRRLVLPSVAHNPAAMTALEELNQSSLELILVEIPISDRASYQTIANSISDIPVRPSIYLPMRGKVCLGVIWAALVLNFLGTHFSAMVTLPTAELTPGYKAAQQRTAWAILIAVICVGAGLMWSYRVHLGLAIPLMSTALLASVNGGSALQKRTNLVPSTQRLLRLLFLGVLFAGIGVAAQRPLEIEYLLVHPPLWGMILLSLATAYFAIKLNGQLESDCRARIAVGNDPVLSFSDLQQASAKLRSLRLGKPADPYGRGVSLMAGIGWFLLLVVLVQSYAPTFWFSHIVNKVLLTQLPMIAAVALVLVGVKWWKRMPFLATMATRPPNRQTQVNQIFTGVAADFARNTPMLAAVVLLVGNNFAEKFGSSIALTITVLLLVIGAVAMIYAFTLWVITVRSTRWAIVSCLLASLFLPAIGGGSVSFLVLKSDLLGAGGGLAAGLGLASAAMIATGIAATVLTLRYYQKLEWGSYLP